jgi:hypothetical protein
VVGSRRWRPHCPYTSPLIPLAPPTHHTNDQGFLINFSRSLLDVLSVPSTLIPDTELAAAIASICSRTVVSHAARASLPPALHPGHPAHPGRLGSGVVTNHLSEAAAAAAVAASAAMLGGSSGGGLGLLDGAGPLGSMGTVDYTGQAPDMMVPVNCGLPILQRQQQQQQQRAYSAAAATASALTGHGGSGTASPALGGPLQYPQQQQPLVAAGHSAGHSGDARAGSGGGGDGEIKLEWKHSCL